MEHQEAKRLRFQLKDYGKIEMVSATGEDLRSKSTLFNLKDMKVTGKIPKKSADLTEFISSLMKKTQENSLKDSKSPLTTESWLTHLSNTTSTSKTCQLIKFQKSITKKSTES